MAEKFIPCSVDDCNGNASSSARGNNGLCRTHYGRLQRHGDPKGGRIHRGSSLAFIRDVAATFNDDACLIWPLTKSSTGYGRLILDGKVLSAHRYVCMISHGDPPTLDHQAAHSCGNGHLGCVNPKHLSWKTPKENQMDRVRHGTHSRGDRHPSAKLTSEDVSAIRGMIESLSLTEIAKRFNVSKTTISRVRTGKSWSHISDEGS